MADKNNIIPYDFDDSWTDGTTVSADKNKDKHGRYRLGTLFMIVDFRETKTVRWHVERCPYVKEYAGIAHDLDTYSQEDLVKALQQGRSPDWKVGDTKKHHTHVFLRCKRVRPDTLAKDLGIPVQHIEYVKSPYGALSYLTHRGWEEKHQYSDDEVWSNFNWLAERDGSKKTNELDEILKQVETGEITKNNVAARLSMSQYVQYKSKLQDAFDFYDKQHKHDHIDRIGIYITSGISGSGKSVNAETLARYIADKKGWDWCYLSTGKDPWSLYRGEEIVIWDDRDLHDFTREGFLNQFDTYAKGPIGSRFTDKVQRQKITIVTNIRSLSDQIREIKGVAPDEDITQFYRRIQVVADVQPDAVYIYTYDDNTKWYRLQRQLPNAVLWNAISQPRTDLVQDVLDGFEGIQREALEDLMARQDVKASELAKQLRDQADFIDATFSIKDDDSGMP